MASETVYSNDFYAKYSVVRQYLEMMALAALGFLLPFTLGHPQIVVGVLVNAFIIRAALTLPQNRALPVVFTPVLGVLARGIIFGPFTLLLTYMMPFIWAGNLILLLSFKTKQLQRFGYASVLLFGSVAKTGLLYCSAYILFSAGILPQIMVAAMGSIQLVTALAGGILAYGSLKAEGYIQRQ